MENYYVGRHMGLSRSRDVLTDMNNVRHSLRRLNPGAYSAPLQVSLCTGYDRDGEPEREFFHADLLPLYFQSPVVREELRDLDARPTRDTVFEVAGGRLPRNAFSVLLAYCNGSAGASNWAADLDAEPRLAYAVYDLACAYEIPMLERLVQNSAFSQETGSLCAETAVRLLVRAQDRSPALYRIAFLYVCYNVREVATSAEWKDLPGAELRRLFMSKHLRCSEEVRFYDMAIRWLHGGEGESEELLGRRQEMFWRLMRRIMYCLVSADDILRYRQVATDMYHDDNQLPPYAPVDRRREGSFTTFTAFRLGSDYFTKVRDARRPEYRDYGPPRYIGQFRSLGYYWSLEVVWYHPGNTSGHKEGVGIFLRLMHGTDKAGATKAGEVTGVLTDFMLRLHCSNDYNRCRKASRALQYDMLNLPGKADSIGDRHFLGYSEAKDLLKKNLDLHVSVEIRRVRELTARNDY